jgi:hypothetical protein
MSDFIKVHNCIMHKSLVSLRKVNGNYFVFDTHELMRDLMFAIIDCIDFECIGRKVTKKEYERICKELGVE